MIKFVGINIDAAFRPSVSILTLTRHQIPPWAQIGQLYRRLDCHSNDPSLHPDVS
jgi:hypothetical protein